MIGTARCRLGIDCGSTRVRVVRLERCAGRTRLGAVAVRDLPVGILQGTDADADALGTVLEQLVDELAARRVKCVLGMADADATLHPVAFPAMSWHARRRAAEFESDRWSRWARQARVVRVYPLDAVRRNCVLAIAARAALQRILRITRCAKVRVAVVDHVAYAYRRVFPGYDAVLDMGATGATLHEFGEPVPRSFAVPEGAGNAITAAIARDLAVPDALAEARKRVVGTAGAGLDARRAFVERIGSLVRALWSDPSRRSIALVGNASRLDRLAAELAAGTLARVEHPIGDVLRTGTYPDDVVRAAAPDWSLAAGLALGYLR